MYKLVKSLIICLVIIIPQTAYSKKLDIELLFQKSKYSNVTLSPSGEYTAFSYLEDGETKSYIVKSDFSEVTASFAFGKGMQVTPLLWLNEKRVVLRVSRITNYLDGKQTKARVFASNFNGKKRRVLFEGPYEILSLYKDDPSKLLVEYTPSNKAGAIVLQEYDIFTGKYKNLPEEKHPKGIFSENPGLIDATADEFGNVETATELDIGDERFDDVDDIYTYHYKHDNSWNKLTLPENKENLKPTISLVGFSKDKSKLYFLSNFDQKEGAPLAAFELDVRTKEKTLVFRHEDVSVSSGVFDSSGAVVGFNYSPVFPSTFYLDYENPYVQTLRALRATFKGERVVDLGVSDNGDIWSIVVYGPKNPGDYYLYNKKNNTLTKVASIFDGLNADELQETEVFKIKARDGVTLYGMLTLPAGKGENLPLIVLPHGGPRASDNWGYNAENQFLANRGYAVLTVDFRGSTGYGDNFVDLGNRQWGRTMQNDITDATLWAINEGIADKNRICLYGTSYGGYATLQGLVREPKLYKCGVGIGGVYSLPLMWEKWDGLENNGRRYSQTFLEEIIGSDEEELKAYSPVYNANKISSKVFLIHGVDDIRVPVEHAYQMEKALLKAGHKVETLYVEGEGHGFSEVKNRQNQYEMVEKFLKANIQ